MTTIQLHPSFKETPMKKIVVAVLTLVGLTVIVKLVADKIND